jgi:hypothetical protein
VTAPRALLLDLHRQGFRLAPDGRGGIRVRPASRLSPELLEAIRANKAALLAELRGQAECLFREAERKVAELPDDPAWRRAWQARRAYRGSADPLPGVLRTAAACLAVAGGHRDAGDPEATRSACEFVMDIALGKIWDGLRATGDGSDAFVAPADR